MEIIVQPSAEAADQLAADMVAQLLKKKPATVLGLAAGRTPRGLYRELVRRHREEGLDFSRATSFNLDEYVGLPPDHPASYHYFMYENLFNHINLPRQRIHIPDGMAADLPAACAGYEKSIGEAGGIDLQILGIGADGHVGFNEPSSSLASRTRLKTLTEQTRRDNAPWFKDPGQTPRHVITMGVGTILESRVCVLLAFGAGKARAVAATVEGPITAMVPASALQLHPAVKLILDPEAARALTRLDYYRWVYENKPANPGEFP